MPHGHFVSLPYQATQWAAQNAGPVYRQISRSAGDFRRWLWGVANVRNVAALGLYAGSCLTGMQTVSRLTALNSEIDHGDLLAEATRLAASCAIGGAGFLTAGVLAGVGYIHSARVPADYHARVITHAGIAGLTLGLLRAKAHFAVGRAIGQATARDPSICSPTEACSDISCTDEVCACISACTVLAPVPAPLCFPWEAPPTV